ncbi:hypothetical protein TNCT_378951 [Trichonephila clavata]|uniref:Uncharacterized protein n=1 Tax=Trichonephila clavata TaxID=2740835 RepID=A0A8X6F3Y1_TRICU|nr:hypothetical protein TNCT_378951 [Trichonephila clavata]
MCSRSRALQLTLARLKSGHLISIKFQSGERIFPVSPSHVACLGVSCRHLMAELERIFELLVPQGLLGPGAAFPTPGV